MTDRALFIEHPTQTRIRELKSVSREFIANVSVSIECGDIGMTELELSRLATRLLFDHLSGGSELEKLRADLKEARELGLKWQAEAEMLSEGIVMDD